MITAVIACAVSPRDAKIIRIIIIIINIKTNSANTNSSVGYNDNSNDNNGDHIDRKDSTNTGSACCLSSGWGNCKDLVITARMVIIIVILCTGV